MNMPFPSPPPLVRTLSDDQMMLDASPIYSSPMRTVPGYTAHPQPTAGLGISLCEMGPPVDQTRLYPTDSYPPTTTDWADHLMPPETLLEAALDVEHFSPVTNYEPFGGCTDVSTSPLSYYSSHNMGASPDFGSAIEVASNHDVMCGQPSGFWPTTPRSDVMSHPDIQCKVKEEPDECWGQSLLPNVSHATGAPMVAQIPQLVVNDTFPSPQPSNGSNGTLVELDSNVERATDRSRGNAPQSLELVFKWTKDKERSSHDELFKIPSASGLQCTICGTCFTRRSNCREHMKRHDPNRRKSYLCDTCERPFGRRTDLRRHVNSIHRGIKNYGCDQCPQRFSRQDTLSRHRVDCSQRKLKRANAFKRETSATEFPSSPSANSASRNKMLRHSPEN